MLTVLVFTIKANNTGKNIKLALESLTNARAKVAGIALTGVKKNDLTSGYYYYYSNYEKDNVK